jgi:glucose dehydrogenase
MIGNASRRTITGFVVVAVVLGGYDFGRLPLRASAAQSVEQPSRRNVDWPAYGGSVNGDHYSALSQINRGNVAGLKAVWQFDTGEKGGIQTNPLIVGRFLYAFTPSQKVVALDGATGRLIWKFDSGLHGTQPDRGFAYWTDGAKSRIFAGVMNFLYALDAATGKPLAEFGENGRIDLRKELRGDYEQQSIALTSPGVIYKDLIIVGGRNPETHPAPPGDIRAFDVHTGALRWRFHTIPHPEEFGYGTWPKDAWKEAGAANNWAGMALDAKRGIVYVPTGSAVFDFYGGDRVGDDLFADTLLALDAATGKRIWSFQGVHHDIWDRDFPSPPALVTIRPGGRPVDAIAQTTKQGFLYLFDRVTGAPLFPIEERAYPPSDVPGEVASPTQPVPSSPEPYARQKLTEDMLTTRTPEAHAWAAEQFKTFRSGGQFVPFSLDKQTVVFPGFDGGGEWGGPAVDPSTGVLYVNANEMAWTGGLLENAAAGDLGEAVYRSQCAVCHGEDRAGSPPAFPSLIGIDGRLREQQILAVIGQGKGRMPPFSNLLAEQLTALLNYLKVAPHSPGPNSASDKKELVSSGAPASVESSQDNNPPGAAVYQQKCAVCHGDHMEGMPPSFPTLLGAGQRLSIAQIVALIHEGRGRMPAQRDIQGAELDALLRYLGVDLTARPHYLTAGGGGGKYGFTGYRKFLDPDGYPAIKPPWGTLNAIDLNTGRYLWKVPLGEYPALAAQGMKDTGSENYGGPIVTAGGLVFIGATVYDRKFRAFDSDTGQLLWETELPFGGLATPATYSIDGKQYVAIAASGGRDPKSPTGGVYVAFALP